VHWIGNRRWWDEKKRRKEIRIAVRFEGKKNRGILDLGGLSIRTNRRATTAAVDFQCPGGDHAKRRKDKNYRHKA